MITSEINDRLIAVCNDLTAAHATLVALAAELLDGKTVDLQPAVQQGIEALGEQPLNARRLEHGIQTLPQMGQGRCILPNVQSISRGRRLRIHHDPLSVNVPFTCRAMDGTITKVHRHGQGAKGGLKARPSGALAAA